MDSVAASMLVLLSLSAGLFASNQAQDQESAVILDQTDVVVTGLRGHHILAIDETPDGGLLVATDQQPGLYEARGDRFVPATLCNDRGWNLSNPDQVYSYYEADGRTWWVQRWNTASAVMYREPGASCWQQDSLRSTADIVHMEISAGRLVARNSSGPWYVLYTGEIVEISPTTTPNDWTTTAPIDASLVPELSASSITALTVDREGIAWVGTHSGILRVARETWTIPAPDVGSVSAVVADAFFAVEDQDQDRVFSATENGWEQIPLCDPGTDVRVAIRRLATHDDELFVATNIGLGRYNRSTGCLALPSPWEYGPIVELHVDQQEEELWVVAERGLLSLDLNSNQLTPFPLADTRSLLSVWQDADEQLVLSQIDAIPRSPGDPETFDPGTRVRGTLVADRSLVAERNSKTLQVLDDGTQISLDAYVFEIEAAAPGLPRAWVGTDDGLWLVDIDTASTTQFVVADGLPSLNVYDIDVGADGRVWIATDAGLVVHADAGRPPAVNWVAVTGNGPGCESCRPNEIHYDSTELLVDWSGVDTADWRGVRADLIVDGTLVDSAINEPLTYDIEQGRAYDVELRLTDRHFNQTEHQLGTVHVLTTPVGVQLRRAASNPLAWIAFGAFVTLGLAVFTAWRRAGRARVRDAHLLITSATDSRENNTTSITTRLTIERPALLRWLRPSEIHATGSVAWDVVRPNSVGREEVSAKTGHQLLVAAAGDAGASSLARIVDSRFSANTRLRIEPANDQVAVTTNWLPWEALADDAGPLTDRRLTITRGVVDAPPHQRSNRQLRVLAVRAHLKGADELGSWEAQQQALHEAFGEVHVSIRECTSDGPHRFEDLAGWLAEGWDIVHIYGHGETDPDFGGYVQFPTESERGNVTEYGKLVTGRELAKALAGASTPPLLVVVAACRTSSPNQSASAELGPAEWLVSQGHCSYAIGFAYEFDQPEIAKFAQAFYPQLTRGLQVDIALTRARQALGGSHERSALRVYGGPRSGELYERK